VIQYVSKLFTRQPGITNQVTLIYQQHSLSLMMIRKHTFPLTNIVVFVAQTVLTQIISCTSF